MRWIQFDIIDFKKGRRGAWPMEVAFRSGKDKKSDALLETPERTAAMLTILAQRDPFLISDTC